MSTSGHLGSAEVEPCPQHVKARQAERHARLQELGYSNYREYLKAPHWAKLKARYRASDLPQECVCGDPDVHLHHTTYERIGAERLTDLVPLCRSCHRLVHVLEWRRQLGLDLEGLCDQERAIQGRALLKSMIEARAAEAREQLRQEQAAVLALAFPSRLLRAVTHARARHIDISGHLHVLRSMAKQGRSDRLMTKRLRRIEEIAYAWEGWAE